MTVLTHPALDVAFNKRGPQCATVNDYARFSGLPTEQVLEDLEPYLESGQLALEFVGSEVFVHTAPHGRAGTADRAKAGLFPPNMWEMLRERADPQTGYVLWRLALQLRRHGWQVETQTSRIRSGLGTLTNVAHLGLSIRQAVIPVLVFPTPDSLSVPSGLLSEYAAAGAATVAVVCDAGALDQVAVAVREWNLVRTSRHGQGVNVLILEAPTFPPVLLTPNDSSVQPISLAALNHPDAWKAQPDTGPADKPS